MIFQALMTTLMIYLEKNLRFACSRVGKSVLKTKSIQTVMINCYDQKKLSKHHPKNRHPTNILSISILSIFIPFCQSWFQPKRKKKQQQTPHILDLPPPRKTPKHQTKKSRLSKLKTQQHPLKKGPFSIGKTSSNRSKKKNQVLFTCCSLFQFSFGTYILHLEGTELARHLLTPPPQSVGISHPRRLNGWFT